MEKSGDLPPSYQPQGPGYGNPQAPPSYNQATPQEPGRPPQYPPPAGHPQYPPPGQQQTNYGPPPQHVYQQQYPNVIVHQPMFVNTANSPPPPDHMTAAIFATLCCFWPTGIVAIMKANDAKNAWQRGDAALAHTNARSAKTMVNISIIAGICSLIFLAIFIGVYVGVIVNSRDYYDEDYYN